MTLSIGGNYICTWRALDEGIKEIEMVREKVFERVGGEAFGTSSSEAGPGKDIFCESLCLGQEKKGKEKQPHEGRGLGEGEWRQKKSRKRKERALGNEKGYTKILGQYEGISAETRGISKKGRGDGLLLNRVGGFRV